MQNFYTSLDYQDLLVVTGEDNEKFLQGQLTCDLDNLSDGQCVLGAACNTKGRVYSSFRVLKHDKAFYLVMQPGLADATTTTLKKYIPFYKAEMADASSRFQRLGLAGEEALEQLGKLTPALPEAGNSLAVDGAILINLGGTIPRFEIWSENGGSTLFTTSEKLQEASRTDWQALDLAEGIFLINQDDIEKYTPEEMNMDLAGFISFDKGCYTGQEIVARMHYRGKAGKRLFVVTLESPSELTENTLVNTSDKALGIITNILYLKDNIVKSFAVLKADINLAEDCYLKNGETTIPVTITPLPAT